MLTPDQNTPQQYTIQDILHGCQAGRLQSVGIMQVIPLLSELQDDSFAVPSQAYIATTDYGTLQVRKNGTKPILIPVHSGWVVPECAQDHALPHALIVDQDEQSCDTAMCIEESQGGYISTKNHKLLILPYALRESAHTVRHERSYHKLWSAIQKFNEENEVVAIGELKHYLNAFQQELDTFVAQFEPVPKQVGAIILINGYVIGIERAPSYEYWLDIWKALIRECYGSFALTVSKQYEPRDVVIPMRQAGIKGLNDILVALKEARQQEEELVKQKIRTLLNDAFESQVEQEAAGFVLESLQNKQLIGQIVRIGKTIPYASLTVCKDWRKQQLWEEAKSFRL